jgi:DNA-binding response OmpR family regulator
MTGEAITILLVEDNPDHAELVIRGLKSNNVANNIIHVEDGETALDYVLQRGVYALSESPRPHLILLDLRLPRIDGLEVLKSLKTNDDTKRTPVVILTTSDAERDIAMAYDYHANSYMVKPVNFEKFMELTKTLGFYWFVWNKQPE